MNLARFETDGRRNVAVRIIVVALLSAAFLTACGGSKVLKKTEPLKLTRPLASASDQRFEAHLDWVIVRNGPGSWARNADWDEYFLRVRNLSVETLRVTSVVVIDSLDTSVAIGGNRRHLIEGSKLTAHRYKDAGLQVKAGVGGDVLFAAGGSVAVASTAVAFATLSGAAPVGAAGAAAAGLVVVAPALIIGGMVRGFNEQRSTE